MRRGSFSIRIFKDQVITSSRNVAKNTTSKISVAQMKQNVKKKMQWRLFGSSSEWVWPLKRLPAFRTK